MFETTNQIIVTTTTTARSLEQLILGPEYHLSHLSHLAAFEDQTQKVERFLSPSLWSPWRRLSFDGTSKSCSFGTLCGLEHHRYGPLIPEKTQDIFSHRNHQLGARQTNYCSPSPTSPVAGRKHSPAKTGKRHELLGDFIRMRRMRLLWKWDAYHQQNLGFRWI